jgi:uncharacterized protein (DUF488 family)
MAQDTPRSFTLNDSEPSAKLNMKLYTLGHSDHTIENFLELLQNARVQAVLDARSTPHSRFYPQFRMDSLKTVLEQNAISYQYAGYDLGGRPVDLACYRDGIVAYDLVMNRPWFEDGIQRLLKLAEDIPTAVMCAEEDPSHCHRHNLISVYILHNHPGWQIVHLRSDGTQVDATSLTGSQQPALFQP